MALVATLPVRVFAKQWVTWRHSPTEPLPSFVDAMKANVPDVYDAILRVTTLQGVEAADALKHAVALTFGRFGGIVHCAFLYALMIYIWSSDASAQAAQVQNLLSTYISMEHAMLATLLVTCKDAYAASVTAGTMHMVITAAHSSLWWPLQSNRGSAG